jgi:hypothetical protein
MHVPGQGGFHPARPAQIGQTDRQNGRTEVDQSRNTLIRQSNLAGGSYGDRYGRQARRKTAQDHGA